MNRCVEDRVVELAVRRLVAAFRPVGVILFGLKAGGLLRRLAMWTSPWCCPTSRTPLRQRPSLEAVPEGALNGRRGAATPALRSARDGTVRGEVRILAAESRRWYFAYGSNMNTEQLENRIGRRGVSWKIACLPGYELVFDKPSCDGTGYANIRVKAEATVYGVLYELTEPELRKLDAYEGVPRHYRREKIVAVLEDGERVVAETYIAVLTREVLRPSEGYLSRIIEGAEEHGLPADYIEGLRRRAYGGCH